MEMTNEKNNQEEDEEIRQSRVWDGYAMMGTWDGNGIWYTNNQWTGSGTWQGGMLSGTWDGKGTWEGDGNGEWKGDGRMESNMQFEKNTGRLIYVIGFVAVAVIGLISKGLVVGLFGWITTIIIFVVIGAIAIVVILGTQSTNKGKLWLKGTWKDDGEFRILEMGGKWKLGIHKGTIRGKMKDHKPSKGEMKEIR